jgi:hypothetical protein
MRVQGNRPVSGHVFRVPRKRGAQWYVKYRGPDGRQVQRRLGYEWTESGPAPVGFLTRKTAEAALQAILTDVRRGAFEVKAQTGATVAEAAAEWLRHAEFERDVKPSTLREYNSIVAAHLVPAFGALSVEALTTREIELWRSRLIEEGKLSRRTISKVLTALEGLLLGGAHEPHNPSARPCCRTLLAAAATELLGIFTRGLLACKSPLICSLIWPSRYENGDRQRSEITNPDASGLELLRGGCSIAIQLSFEDEGVSKMKASWRRTGENLRLPPTTPPLLPT